MPEDDNAATYTQLGKVAVLGSIVAVTEAEERALLAYRAEVLALRTALQECADELEEWVEHYYELTKEHPSEKRRYARDMEPVGRARALLARE